MIEQLVDPQKLTGNALVVVERLKEVAQNHQRTYPAKIDAVFVFSGPGTYYDRLKPGQQEYVRWMDRDRIRAGVAVVKEVTAQRIAETEKTTIRGHHISKEAILKYGGPYFVYNGVPVENEILRRALKSPYCPLPTEKTLIIDEVYEGDHIIPIRHTGDQFKSFYQAITNPNCPLFGIKNVALVAHIPDFIRHPFYAEEYNRRLGAANGQPLNFWFYALRSRLGTEEAHMEAELQRLPVYAAKGDLATEPVIFST